MESFSLLKYWRGSGGGGGGNAGVDVASNNVHTDSGTTTIVTAVAQTVAEPDDDGPFFDLEFTVPDEDADDAESHGRRDEEEEEGQNEEEHDNGTVKMINCLNNDNSEEGDDDDGDISYDDDCEGEEDEEEEFNFTLSSGSSNDRIETNPSLSPSDDLFFKGRLVPINGSEQEEDDEGEGEGDDVEGNLNSNSKVQFPVSLIKSATKFRVFMLGLKKSKSNIAEEKIKEATNGSDTSPNPLPIEQKQSNKSFTVKFKVEEVPIISLFSKDSRNSSANKSQKLNPEESASDEKRFSKEVMQKYLKKVKPLYIRVSKRYGEKLRFSGQLSLKNSSPVLAAAARQKPTPVKPTTAEKCASESELVVVAPAANVKTQKQGNLPAGLRVVCKHLGKSRSASSAAETAVSSVQATSRRDDSLLLQQDNIQGAILHCKRSFNASKDSESLVLSRSVSDPLHEKSNK